MMKNIRFLMIVMIAIIFTAAALAGPPDWYSQSRHRSYPGEFYLIGVGAGDSYDKAVFNAQMMIASQLQAKIEEEITHIISDYQDGDRGEVSSQYHAIGKTRVEAQLIHAEIVEKYEEDGNHYVMIVIDKDDLADNMRQQLDQEAKSLTGLFTHTDSLITRGMYFQGLENLVSGEKRAGEFFTDVMIYTSVSNESYPSELVPYPPEILNRLKEIVAGTSLEVISGNYQSVVRGRFLPEPVVIRAVSSLNGSSHPIPDVTIFTQGQNGVKSNSQISDRNGEAEFILRAFARKRGKYSFRIEIPGLPQSFKDEIHRIRTEIEYNVVDSPPLEFQVIVASEDDIETKSLEKKIRKAVTGAGYVVSREAPFIISGSAGINEMKEVESMDGTTWLAKATLTLQLQVSGSGEAISLIVIKGNGLDKKSRRRAKRKAIKRLKINEKELIRMISDSEDELFEYLDSPVLNKVKSKEKESRY